MKAAIREQALKLGFDDCRFTTTAPPASAKNFQQWLDRKNHGEMSYIERNADKRTDPQRVLPGAKSVICLAASYHSERQNSEFRSQETESRTGKNWVQSEHR
jgi:epoxyqueuosine reductase